MYIVEVCLHCRGGNDGVVTFPRLNSFVFLQLFIPGLWIVCGVLFRDVCSCLPFVSAVIPRLSAVKFYSSHMIKRLNNVIVVNKWLQTFSALYRSSGIKRGSTWHHKNLSVISNFQSRECLLIIYTVCIQQYICSFWTAQLITYQFQNCSNQLSTYYHI